MSKTSEIVTVKVLSVRQPWASLIVMGYKDVENRTWTTPIPMNGKLGLFNLDVIAEALQILRRRKK